MHNKLKYLIVKPSEIKLKLQSVNIDEIFNKIKEEAQSIINEVKLPSLRTNAGISLVILYLFKNKLIHKKDISIVGSEYLNIEPTDWQVRHLSAQDGFYIIGRGQVVPNTDIKCPSGYHSLITLNSLSPKFIALKRSASLSNPDFEQIKKLFGNRCAHCGSEENKENYRDGAITILQKGHIDSNLPLEAGNAIPLCDYCNRTYQNRYDFLTNGAVDRPNIKNEHIAKKLIEDIIKIHTKQKLLDWLE